MARVLQRTMPHCAISHALRHTRRRTPQAQRTHAERLEGLRGLFTVTAPQKIRGKRILLLEDVITTGATIAAASSALRRAGADGVDVLALAQARVWTRFRARVHEIFEDG
jgi:predicted amidophosphoribosyltransferase